MLALAFLLALSPPCLPPLGTRRPASSEPCTSQPLPHGGQVLPQRRRCRPCRRCRLRRRQAFRSRHRQWQAWIPRSQQPTWRQRTMSGQATQRSRQFFHREPPTWPPHTPTRTPLRPRGPHPRPWGAGPCVVTIGRAGVRSWRPDNLDGGSARRRNCSHTRLGSALVSCLPPQAATALGAGVSLALASGLCVRR